MKESLNKAGGELKRADHLIFVSLKYTRTVDVIRSVIERLINAFDFGIESLLRQAKKKKKVKSISKIPMVRVESLKKVYSEEEIVKDYLQLYVLLRKLIKSRFERSQEYRRHVTMTSDIDEGAVEVDINIITNYFEKTKEFIEYCKDLIEGKKNE